MDAIVLIIGVALVGIILFLVFHDLNRICFTSVKLTKNWRMNLCQTH